ncbi:molybdenum cofactor biosynthesis protein B [Halothiobacillus sp.]|uniref:molybdenum cofactor biosynthesis protein B n=1 Tax=Halothiobacillus sp. TaxID=1891311 RepID=UPI00263376CA|nr:molybdenum cofactor biosynthesis protein B [Halothiobacillus sp.]
MNTRAFVPLNIAVLTVSDTRSLKNDPSGDLLQGRVIDGGHRLYDRQIVRDDKYAIRAVVSAWIANPVCQVIITTGGTGLTGRDGTPEAVIPLLDKEIEGFGELFRWLSFQSIGTSTLQSRATSGVANGTYLFILPGSTSACRDAWDQIIHPQLDFRTRPCNMVELMPRLNEQ